MIEKFKLKNGKTVLIKNLTIEDCELNNNNYEFMHIWLDQVSKYMTREFKREDLKRDKERYYKILSNSEEYVVIGAMYNS